MAMNIFVGVPADASAYITFKPFF